MVALIAAVAALLAPAGASAASPVLEFVAPGHGLPVGFTTESGQVTADMENFGSTVACKASAGEGEITGPRTAVAKYQFTECATQETHSRSCQTEGAQPGEITTESIEADLVWINQEKDEVGMLLNPNGGPTQPYISFECGGEQAEGFGPFLSPGSPINKDVSAFTLTLQRSGSTQTITEYEGEKGENLQAIPTGKVGTESGPTGVEMTVTVHTSSPVEVKALTAKEVEAKQHEEEAAKKKQEEEAATAAAKKHQEEEAAAVAKKKVEEEAAKKKAEEEAAAKKRAEEAVKKKQEESKKPKSKPATRAQLLAKALNQCKKDKSPKGRVRCVLKAEKKYGKAKKKKHKN